MVGSCDRLDALTLAAAHRAAMPAAPCHRRVVAAGGFIDTSRGRFAVAPRFR